MNFYMKGDHLIMRTDKNELLISANDDSGFKPFELMVTSIAGCSASVLNKILQKMRVDVTELSVKADVQREENSSRRILAIHLHFIAVGNNLPNEKINRALRLAHKHCSMVQSVKNSIDVTESIEIRSS